MKSLAIALRAAQFTAHNYHNTVTGPSFFADHEHLGGLYGAYEGEYDSVVERMIGLGLPCDLNAITTAAAKTSGTSVTGLATPMFKALLAREAQIIAEIEVACAEEVSEGTENLLQQLADNSEARQYKMKQRIKGA